MTYAPGEEPITPEEAKAAIEAEEPEDEDAELPEEPLEAELVDEPEGEDE